ncbi:unnamed protein product [Porites evermanni]|uniref:DZIP3-like HEPN domain-containing protein n=1 Tax=Porites evermanni TaxID=104178 RepID=A0ABN8PW49_9CNID|nr:unnamed protein product [Porites evermanni]
MASAPTLAPCSKETTNYARLCCLLVDGGAKALRYTFDKIHSAANLFNVLKAGSAEHSTLQSLKRKRIINATQWGKLYPSPPSSVTSDDFDITLLMVLLRNICGLAAPATGWDSLPPASDTSVEANIARVKYYRNSVNGHASQASVDNPTFNSLWQDVSAALVVLGVDAAAITKLKTETMDPDTEKHYRELLKEWKKDEDNIKDQLDRMEGKLREQMKSEMGNMSEKLEAMRNSVAEDGEQMRSEMENISGKITEEGGQFRINFDNGWRRDHKHKIMDGLFAKIRFSVSSTFATGWGFNKEILHEAICNDEFSGNNVVTMLRQLKTFSEHFYNTQNRGCESPRAPCHVCHTQTFCRPLLSAVLLRKLTIVRENRAVPKDWGQPISFIFSAFKTKLIRLTLVTLRRFSGCSLPRWTTPLRGCHVLKIDFPSDDSRPDLHQLFSCQPLRNLLMNERLLKLCKQKQFTIFRAHIYLQTEFILGELFEVDNPMTGRDFDWMVSNQAVWGWKAPVKASVSGVSLLQLSPFFASIFPPFLQKHLIPQATIAHKLRLAVPNLKAMKSDISETLKTLVSAPKEEGQFSHTVARWKLSLRLKSLLRASIANGSVIICRTSLYQYPALQALKGKGGEEEKRVPPLHTYIHTYMNFIYPRILVSKRRPCMCYGFTHKSFQEFFAAHYLCCQLVSKETSPEILVTDTRYFGELREVLKFTCGLLAVRSKEIAVALIISIANKLNNENVEKCLPLAVDCIKECKIESSNFHMELARTFGACLALQQGEIRHRDIDDAAAAVIAAVLEANTTLTNLDLSRNSVGPAGAESLATALKTNTTLTNLDLSQNNVGPAGADSLATALKTNTTLTNLDLSQNNVGPAGAESLATALKTNTTLTNLNLSRNNVGPAGAESLATALKTNTNLTNLDLSQNNVGPAGAESLATALKTNTTLTNLDLSQNNLGPTGAESLATALKTNTTLTNLDLSYNNVGSAGAESLATALKTNTTLTNLDSSENNLGPAGAESLATALKTNTTLRILNLRFNNLGSDRAEFLSKTLEANTTLKKLSAIFQPSRPAWRNQGSQGIKTNTTLTNLDLSENNLGPAGAESLATALKTNTTLRILNLRCNNLSSDSAEFLAKALEANTTLKK